MARNNDRDRGRRAAKDTRPTRGKKKICIFCAGKVEWVDYKDINTLRRFTSDRGPGRGPRDRDRERAPRMAEADSELDEDLADELDLGTAGEDANADADA